MALTEQLLRTPIMSILVGVSWLHQLLLTIPVYINFMMVSLLICTLIPSILKQKKFKFLKFIVLVILGSLLIFYLKTAVQYFLSPFVNSISQGESHEPLLHMNILIPAYITFLEPVIAAFIVFALIRKKISKVNILLQGLIMAGIIIIIHGGFSSFIQIIFSKGNLFYRIFYYGQFLWEYLILGTLTSLSFAFFERKSIFSMPERKETRV